MNSNEPDRKQIPAAPLPDGGRIDRNPMRLRKSAKIGRNKPCPCGSSKKYKYCCLVKQQEQMKQQMEIRRTWDEFQKKSEKKKRDKEIMSDGIKELIPTKRASDQGI